MAGCESMNTLSDDDPGLRTVVIHRGSNGYGLVVSGETPVSVQEVKDGGPADQAGVKKGDSIIKVNGQLVSLINHKEVVQIIKSEQSVSLTLRSQPEIESPTLNHSESFRNVSRNERITGPLPVDIPIQSQLDANKVKTLQTYLDTQRRVRDSLIAELSHCSSKPVEKNIERRLEVVDLQINKIQMELMNMKEHELFLRPHSPRSPRLSNTSFSYHDHHGSHPYRSSLHSSRHSAYHNVPPPLPVRNRSLMSQASAPNVLNSAMLNSPPPVPPRTAYSEKSEGDGGSGLTQSLENIPKGPSLCHSVSSVSDSAVRCSHNRSKSSSDPLTLTGSSGTNKLSISESFTDFTTGKSRCSPGLTEEALNMSSPVTSPVSGVGRNTNVGQGEEDHYSSVPDDGDTICAPFTSPYPNILNLEDDEYSDPEQMEDHGPFQALQKLWAHNAHLAVFMNYLISNCDSSSLFFHIITDLYKEGTLKEMKKWAYEIHSSFLVPGAPMRLNNIDNTILVEIDETLNFHLDKEEIMRKVFWKARQKSREELNEQLADFRSKRSSGLGAIYGPADAKLEESIQNKAKELGIIEQVLVPCLENISDNVRTDDHLFVMASSLAAVLWRYFNLRSATALQLIDRFPLFVNKDRPLKNKLFKGSKKIMLREHHFNHQTYYNVTFCNHCGLIIWGVSPQGYQCSNCEMNVHKTCVKQVEETCIGQLHKKDKSRDVRFSILGKIMPDEKDSRRKNSQGITTPLDRSRRGLDNAESGLDFELSIASGDKGGYPSCPKEQRRSDPGTGSANTTLGTRQSSSNSIDQDEAEGDADSTLMSPDASSAEGGPSSGSRSALNSKKKSGGAINRSESCKEKQNLRKRTRDNRKHSDPNIPNTKAGDADGESGHNYTNSDSSASSSISQGLDSPSNSIDQSTCPESFQELENDSDVEAETDLPDWQQSLSSKQLDQLDSRERKKQDTINELFHTERTHVRVLKILRSLFYDPLKKMIPADLLDLLFPNIDQMLSLHGAFNQAMKKRRSEEPIVQHVGDILINMFDGERGKEFQEAAARFVGSQSQALESLKQHQRREPKLYSFLQDQENHPYCRRLQLKDMLPAGFQRLSKYPLLLEALQGQTDEALLPEEHSQITRALERAKEILAYVNASVRENENRQRLIEIQKRLDQSSLTKNKSTNVEELKGNLDLPKHKLLYDGSLLWKVSRSQKIIDVHVLLLDDFIVLLQKDGDKYILKNHSINSKTAGKDDGRFINLPIIKYDKMLYRDVATDKCAFFIVNMTDSRSQIYELVTSSSSERQVWFKHIEEAQESYKSRDGRSRRPPVSADVDETQPGIADDIGVDDGGDDSGEAYEGAGDTASKGKPNGATEGAGLPSSSAAAPGSQVAGASDSLSKKTEHLRRMDHKIRQALEDKQHLIAEILIIPPEHLENVLDMAGEPALGNKEPKELVLAALHQVKCMQEALNETLNIKDSDIIAARAGQEASGRASTLPLHQTPISKLMKISSLLSQQLNLLLILVSERDEERDRMRKELVSSRERLYAMHVRNTSSISPMPDAEPSSPKTQSRPSSFVSLTSSSQDPVEQLTDEEASSDGQKRVPGPADKTTDVDAEDLKQQASKEGESVSAGEDALTSASEGENTAVEAAPGDTSEDSPEGGAT